MHTLKVFVEASQDFGLYASFYASNVTVSYKQGNSFFIKLVYRSDTVQEKARTLTGTLIFCQNIAEYPSVKTPVESQQ